MWRNGLGDQRCAPERVERPRDAEVAARSWGAARGGPGRRLGAFVHRHRMHRRRAAWTSAPCGACWTWTGTDVTVEAGITLHDLGEELAAYGLALENQGDVESRPSPER